MFHQFVNADTAMDNEPMLKEGGAINNKTKYEAMNFNTPQMFIQSGTPPLSFKHLLSSRCGQSADTLATKHGKTFKLFFEGWH